MEVTGERGSEAGEGSGHNSFCLFYEGFWMEREREKGFLQKELLDVNKLIK